MFKFEDLYFNNHNKKTLEKFKKSKVGFLGINNISGLLAISLAKEGLGNIFVLDDDIVSIKNMAFSCFNFDDIDKINIVALKQKLQKINPYMVCSTYFKNSKNSISSFFHSCDVLVISKQINAKLKLDNALIIKLKEANQNNFLDVIASVHKNLKEIKDFIIAKKN